MHIMHQGSLSIVCNGVHGAIVFSFRLGKMYWYNLEKYDVDSLNSFVGGFYKNLPGEPVPVPKTPL